MFIEEHCAKNSYLSGKDQLFWSAHDAIFNAVPLKDKDCLYLDMAATDRALSQMFRSAILPLIQPQLEFQAKKMLIQISTFKNSSCNL